MRIYRFLRDRLRDFVSEAVAGSIVPGGLCVSIKKRRIHPSEVVMTKFCNGNRLTHATLAATLMVSGLAFAQQATTSDPYSGMSQPPPDTTIVANPDAAAQPAAQPAPSQTAKPSPDVPAAAPAAPPEATTTAAPRLPIRRQPQRRPTIPTTTSSVRFQIRVRVPHLRRACKRDRVPTMTL